MSEKKDRAIFRKVWGMLPLVVLAGCLALIFVFGSTIQAEKAKLAEEQASMAAPERPPVNVVLMEAVPGVVRDRINLPGIIEPWTDLELRAKINGEIIEVPVREGERVSTGEVIARIDPADFRIALDSARASYRLAKANLNRNQQLFAKGLLPKAEIDDLEVRVEVSKAAMEEAELQLSRCTITAPISGVIRRLDAKTGLRLSVADPVARILEIDRVKAVIGIPESDVATVRTIRTVAMTVQALGDRQVMGQFHNLAISPASSARLYNLELAVDNSSEALLPGMFVRAEIVKQEAANSLSVPLYSVISKDGIHSLFVEEDGVARRRPVELGILDEWRVQVRNGISVGSRVIVEGHRSIEEGQRVNVARVLDSGSGATL